VAYASLRNELPSPELARRLLERVAPEQTQGSCTVAAILDATATQFGIGTDSLLARDRRPAVARARKVAMYLARELTGQSFPEIGRGFGDRDHSTVLHAVRSVSTEVTRDPELATAVNNLRTRLSS
jgi:chromosomal replication initiator protein